MDTVSYIKRLTSLNPPYCRIQIAGLGVSPNDQDDGPFNV